MLALAMILAEQKPAVPAPSAIAAHLRHAVEPSSPGPAGGAVNPTGNAMRKNVRFFGLLVDGESINLNFDLSRCGKRIDVPI